MELAAQNVLTAVSDFSRRSKQTVNSSTDTYKIIFDNCIISPIQNFTNVEAHKVLLSID